MTTALVTVSSMSSFKTLPHSPHTLQDIGALVAICAAGCSPVRGPSTGANIGHFALPSTPGLAVVGCPQFATRFSSVGRRFQVGLALESGFCQGSSFNTLLARETYSRTPPAQRLDDEAGREASRLLVPCTRKLKASDHFATGTSEFGGACCTVPWRPQQHDILFIHEWCLFFGTVPR